MKHLLSYLRQYRLQAILAPLFKMLEACFDLTVPLIVADLINTGIASGDRAAVVGRFALMLLMALLGLICSFVAQYFAAKAAIGTACGLRRKLFRKIQSFDHATLDRISTSTLITRMTGDLNQVQNGINMFLRLFLRSPFIVFGAAILAFAVNGRLALIFVAAIMVLFVIVFGIMALTAPRFKKVQGRMDNVTSAVRENVSGVRVIRAFGREEEEKKQFEAINRGLYTAQISTGRIAALTSPLTFLVINAAIIAVLWFGGGAVHDGALLDGDIVALINYLGQILIELVKLANLIVLLAKATTSMGRVGRILDTENEPVAAAPVTDQPCSDAVIELRDVSLRYHEGGDEALSHISLTVRPGETVGIIGGTGSGKSSLTNLIARFYQPSSGALYLFGRPADGFTHEELRRRIAVVEQKPRLFAGTVRSNLLWGNKNADDAALWQALEVAQGAEFVRQKPLLLDDPVEQMGGNLSGGQKQRLTIARALLRNPDILIFDDSTSALDFATEAALRKALRQLPGDMTRIFVTQRASTIAHADRIFVLDDGELVGSGTHEELLHSCPIYREIYESQADKKEGAR